MPMRVKIYNNYTVSISIVNPSKYSTVPVLSVSVIIYVVYYKDHCKINHNASELIGVKSS